ncbi:MAG TPA: hypothetical protein VER79_08525 [Candidatus Limnocylindrales bacterium]|nr:hypothetical protein [Candidatus Limnocylindrales bacterium]
MMNASTPMEDLLSAMTDAVLRGERDVNRIARRYNVPQAEADRLAPMIYALRDAHCSERPSQRYVRKLKRDLMGAPEYTIVERVRYLPPRVQIAAGVAVGTAFGVLLVGRFGLNLLRFLTGRAPVSGLTTVSS